MTRLPAPLALFLRVLRDLRDEIHEPELMPVPERAGRGKGHAHGHFLRCGPRSRKVQGLAVLVTLLSSSTLACTGKAKEPPLAAAPPVVHVESALAEARPMPRTLPLAGALVANREADVAANASGRVTRTFVERGDMVRAGQPLAQLDVRSAAFGKDEALGNLEIVEAQRALADAQCARYQGLFEKGAISRDEWDRFSAQCRTSAGSERAARARADLARKDLADATVRAPFAGMVGERFVDVGEYVHPESKVASVVQISPLRLRLTVPEAEVGRIASKQAVTFEVQAFPGETFRATVVYVGPALRAATRDLVAEAMVPNEDRRLRPGMFATARLELPSEPVVAVPRSALSESGENGASAHVFTVKGGRLEERIVQPGPERDGYVAVLDGLTAGERIVTRLTDQVRDGVPVSSATPVVGGASGLRPQASGEATLGSRGDEPPHRGE